MDKLTLLRARAAAQDALLTEQAEASLRAYVDQAWPVLEPQTPLLPNWHIDAIVEHLEAVTAGDITRLVINVPPRYMKSLLGSVLWPTWEWLRQPAGRWLCVSYSDALASKHSRDRRTVLQSAWYRQRWGSRFTLARDQNMKTEFQNDHRGVMAAMSISGSVTGKGGNRLVIDDPHDPKQAESATQRETTLELFKTTLSTRLDDKRQGAIVLVMQRLHARDLAAVASTWDTPISVSRRSMRPARRSSSRGASASSYAKSATCCGRRAKGRNSCRNSRRSWTLTAMRASINNGRCLAAAGCLSGSGSGPTTSRRSVTPSSNPGIWPLRMRRGVTGWSAWWPGAWGLTITYWTASKIMRRSRRPVARLRPWSPGFPRPPRCSSRTKQMARPSSMRSRGVGP